MMETINELLKFRVSPTRAFSSFLRSYRRLASILPLDGYSIEEYRASRTSGSSSSLQTKLLKAFTKFFTKFFLSLLNSMFTSESIPMLEEIVDCFLLEVLLVL